MRDRDDTKIPFYVRAGMVWLLSEGQYDKAAQKAMEWTGIDDPADVLAFLLNVYQQAKGANDA